MGPNPASYEQLEQNILSWAQARSDLQAAIVVGSRARTDHPADEWSDLDLILFVTDPQVYTAHSEVTAWLRSLEPGTPVEADSGCPNSL